MATHLAHVAIGVKDMERSLALYRDILGFEVISEFAAEGEQLEMMVNLGRAKVRIALLQQDDSTIELCQYLSPVGRGHKDFRQCDQGLIHFALITDQFDSIVGKLRGDDGGEYRFFSDPVDLGIIEGIGEVRAFYFYGPDHEVIELLDVS